MGRARIPRIYVFKAWIASCNREWVWCQHPQHCGRAARAGTAALTVAAAIEALGNPPKVRVFISEEGKF